MRALRSITDTSHDPQPRLAALASRFPGALREIDDLPLEEIDRRIEALIATEKDPQRAEPWMHAMTRFHALARGALFVKRTLGDESVEWPAEAIVWRDDTARIAEPPRGRIMDLVYERLARELAITSEDARSLVFGKKRNATD